MALNQWNIEAFFVKHLMASSRRWCHQQTHINEGKKEEKLRHKKAHTHVKCVSLLFEHIYRKIRLNRHFVGENSTQYEWIHTHMLKWWLNLTSTTCNNTNVSIKFTDDEKKEKNENKKTNELLSFKMSITRCDVSNIDNKKKIEEEKKKSEIIME